MEPFNSSDFIKTLKERRSTIPYIQGNNSAKIMVVDSIKANNYAPEDVLSYLCSTMHIPSTLAEADWKNVIAGAIKTNYSIAKNLRVFKSSLKKKLSYEEMFNLAAECCGRNPIHLKNEISLDLFGWAKVVDALVKSEKETKVENKVEISTEKKTSIKSIKKDPRGKSITLINEKTKEIRTWDTYGACEDEIYGKDKGHGMVSQLVGGKNGLRHLGGIWVLYNGVPEEKKGGMRSRKRPIIQFKIDDRGRKKEIRTFNSITEASQETGIPYSSIWKNVNDIKGYGHTGDYYWKDAETVA